VPAHQALEGQQAPAPVADGAADGAEAVEEVSPEADTAVEGDTAVEQGVAAAPGGAEEGGEVSAP
jgi:hypothetical protein